MSDELKYKQYYQSVSISPVMEEDGSPKLEPSYSYISYTGPQPVFTFSDEENTISPSITFTAGRRGTNFTVPISWTPEFLNDTKSKSVEIPEFETVEKD